jgi:hypothetical protein
MAKVKAAYRFIDNRQTDMQALLQPHIGATIERIQKHKVVLAVQATTTLSYTAHASKDMEPINAKWNSAVGLMMHDTLAFTEDGVPLGLLDVQCWPMIIVAADLFLELLLLFPSGNQVFKTFAYPAQFLSVLALRPMMNTHCNLAIVAKNRRNILNCPARRAGALHLWDGNT